ncbi:MAG: peptidylprolyl isomerase [Candidatus Eremiobacteraeota bacterium]|nr:peptidylprolyl isomerase [Candidatus Eremiobacteraeota bacterium]MBC5801479.1 peptidylprolyl isomerase [Candidatus Eremiobacteraeota bacterium]MBC5820921.1 peptidylprolyl isomerase [Candidatus Eremiobacteraeota bacterium]
MKLAVTFALVASLAIGWQLGGATAENDPYRDIEVAELHRTLAPTVIAALDAEPRVAARAALALGRIGNPAATLPLRARLTARDAGLRAMSAYALGLLADAGAFDAERAALRSDPNSAVRYAAADALGRIVLAHPVLAARGPATDLEIVARLDSDPVVRAHAVIQLDAFSPAPFAGAIARALEGILRDERDPDVRWHAMWALYRGYATRADPSFLRAALRDPQELVRLEALRAWGRRRDGDAAAFGRLAANDPSWRVQLEALETLRRLHHQAATQHQRSIPSFVHLPALPRRPDPAATPRPIPSPDAGPLHAPDSASLPLPAFVPPSDARSMNGSPAPRGEPDGSPAPRGEPDGLAGAHPRVLMRTTKGEVVLRLYSQWAPSTVANFLALAARGYYDHNRWFRIVPDFVDQTGDAHDNADAEPGFTIPAEENPIEQRTGIIAMGLDYAHDHPLRDSAGTQFYLTLSPQLHLDRAFTVFGEVERGNAVLAHLIESDRIIDVRRIP